MLQMKLRRFGGSHLCTFKSAPGAGKTTTQQLAPNAQPLQAIHIPNSLGKPNKNCFCDKQGPLKTPQTAKNKSIVGKKNTAGRYGEPEDLKMSMAQQHQHRSSVGSRAVKVREGVARMPFELRYCGCLWPFGASKVSCHTDIAKAARVHLHSLVLNTTIVF